MIPFRGWGPKNSSHNGRKSQGITPESLDGQPPPSPHNPPSPLPPSRGEAASSNGGTRCYVARIAKADDAVNDLESCLNEFAAIDEISIVAAPFPPALDAGVSLILHRTRTIPRRPARPTSCRSRPGGPHSGPGAAPGRDLATRQPPRAPAVRPAGSPPIATAPPVQAQVKTSPPPPAPGPLRPSEATFLASLMAAAQRPHEPGSSAAGRELGPAPLSPEARCWIGPSNPARGS